MNNLTISMKAPGFEVVRGSIFNTLARPPADLLVCPVNCQPGVMGAGLAKDFARRFPGLRLRHKAACEKGMLGIAEPWIVQDLIALDDRTGERGWDICLFPTKDHWQNDSRIDWIIGGLARLYDRLAEYRPESECVRISIPALGCGLGGLPFDLVAALIRVWASGLPERFDVTLFDQR
jgi:hypothetical protein